MKVAQTLQIGGCGSFTCFLLSQRSVGSEPDTFTRKPTWRKQLKSVLIFPDIIGKYFLIAFKFISNLINLFQIMLDEFSRKLLNANSQNIITSIKSSRYISRNLDELTQLKAQNNFYKNFFSFSKIFNTFKMSVWKIIPVSKIVFDLENCKLYEKNSKQNSQYGSSACCKCDPDVKIMT